MQQIIRRDLLMTQRQTLCQTVSKSLHQNNCSGFLKTLSCLRYLNWTIIHFTSPSEKRFSRAAHLSGGRGEIGRPLGEMGHRS